MYQQINLYQPVFRQEEKIFSSRTLLIIWALVLVLLAGLYLSQRLNLRELESNRVQVETQSDKLQQQLNSMLTSTDQAEADQVTAEIEQLRLSLDNLESLLQQMNGSALPSAAGFSQLLQALAEQRLTGVWLTNIEITSLGEIRLTGVATDERLVPRYIQQLRKNQLLAEKAFSQIQLTSDQTTALTSFVLQSGSAPL